MDIILTLYLVLFNPPCSVLCSGLKIECSVFKKWGINRGKNRVFHRILCGLWKTINTKKAKNC